MKKTHFTVLLICMLLMLTLTSCLPSTLGNQEEKAGFFLGIWHGWIAPISLIVRLFKPETRIYAMNNTGWWYEFGFYMAIISGFGGLSLIRGKRKDHDR